MRRFGAVFLILFWGSGLSFGIEIGICNKGPLRIRQKPSLDSAILGKLVIHEKVIIVEADDEPAQIDGIKARWYRVKTAAGIEGWAFGGYLTILELDSKADIDLVLNSSFIYEHEYRIQI